MQLTGTFQITEWQESVEKFLDEGRKLASAKVCQQYGGDITGNSEVTYQMYYQANGDACFVGFEHVEGSIAGELCQLTIKHDGHFAGGLAKSQFVILNSSHKELNNITGSFEAMKVGKANYLIG